RSQPSAATARLVPGTSSAAQRRQAFRHIGVRERLGEFVDVALARRTNPEPALAVLLVDATSRLSADSLAALAVATVWWDSSGIWRHRWRRSAYGEILEFGADGRLTGTQPPLSAP
ncbi:MAG: hypothetical protein ACRDL7_06945, partial [Gaiellaceae bacterium]